MQFLGGVVDPLVYRKMLPSITTLVRDYNVPPELAMSLCRPAMRSDDPVLQTVPRGVHATGGSNTTNNGTNTDGSISNDPSNGEKSWYMYNSSFLEDIKGALRADTGLGDETEAPFTGMTPEVYATFWGLKLYDIYIPFQQYESEILRLRNSVTSGANASLSASERKKLKEKTTQMIDVLTTEQKDQVAHRKRVYEQLEKMKGRYFKAEPEGPQTAIDELLQKCIIPRSLISPEDALFCAKFMELLHTISTPQLSSLQYFHKMNMKVSAIVLCATEREASNFGFFMKETLGLILRWYQNGATYDDEAIHGKIGMSLDLADGAKSLAHRQFKSAYVRWHQQLELVYTTALSSGEYMPIRNTLVVLTKLIDVFPAGRGTAELILGIVEKLTNEEREDIKIMAKRYFALLTKRKASLSDDRLLRTRNASSKPSTAVPSTNDKKNATVKEEKKSSVDDSSHNERKRDSSSKPASIHAASQEVESGEIVMGKSSNISDTSSWIKERDLERGPGGDRNYIGRGGGGSFAEPSHDHRSRAEREESESYQNISTDTFRELGVDEKQGRQDHRNRELLPTPADRNRELLPTPADRSSSTNTQTNELKDRSGSASRKARRSPPRRSRSGDRAEDRGNNSDSRRSSRERENGRERGQFSRGGQGEGDHRGLGDRRSSRSGSHDRHERNSRNCDVIHGLAENEATRKPEAPQFSRNEEPDKLALSPKPDRAFESAKLNRGARAERDFVKAEPSLLDAGRKRVRPIEQSEAALRRQLTAEKEAKAKEQQSGERTRPIARDRMRPPLSSPVTAFSAGRASPTDAGTLAGGARKIVSLVPSSRKREREPLTDSEAPSSSAGNTLEGKRRRDGGGSNSNWGEPKRGNEDKRKRRNKSGGGDSYNGNQQHQLQHQPQHQPQHQLQHQQRDQMRGRQDRGGRNGSGHFDKRIGQEERRGNSGGGGGGRRHDRNDNRGGRR